MPAAGFGGAIDTAPKRLCSAGGARAACDDNGQRHAPVGCHLAPELAGAVDYNVIHSLFQHIMQLAVNRNPTAKEQFHLVESLNPLLARYDGVLRAEDVPKLEQIRREHHGEVLRCHFVLLGVPNHIIQQLKEKSQ